MCTFTFEITTTKADQILRKLQNLWRKSPCSVWSMAATEHIASSAVFSSLLCTVTLWRNALYILHMLFVSPLETSLDSAYQVLGLIQLLDYKLMHLLDIDIIRHWTHCPSLCSVHFTITCGSFVSSGRARQLVKFRSTNHFLSWIRFEYSCLNLRVSTDLQAPHTAQSRCASPGNLRPRYMIFVFIAQANSCCRGSQKTSRNLVYWSAVSRWILSGQAGWERRYCSLAISLILRLLQQIEAAITRRCKLQLCSFQPTVDYMSAIILMRKDKENLNKTFPKFSHSTLLPSVNQLHEQPSNTSQRFKEKDNETLSSSSHRTTKLARREE